MFDMLNGPHSGNIPIKSRSTLYVMLEPLILFVMKLLETVRMFFEIEITLNVRGRVHVGGLLLDPML